ncbi:MAG: thiol-disulfide oxidoreductase DCC family protein [Saprospiraceae bacterium]
MEKNVSPAHAIPRDKPILLFDGVCNLCNGFVQFLIKRDPNGQFRFTALQSEVGQQLLKEAGMAHNELSTVVLYNNGQFYTHSDVPLEVSWLLGSFWRIFYIFKWIPVSFRNAIYTWIASNRYRWFGQKASCMIPTPALKKRFL